MAVAEMSVVPVGTGSPSISEYVADAQEVLARSGLKYELTSMGTNVEGPPEKILEVALELHKACFARGAVRVLTAVKIDDRSDKPLSIVGKIKSVQDKLGKRK